MANGYRECGSQNARPFYFLVLINIFYQSWNYLKNVYVNCN